MRQSQNQAGALARWLVPITILLLCAAAIYISTTFARMPPILKRGIQPADFPRLVALLIVGLTLLMMWREPLRRTVRTAPASWLTMLGMAGFAIVCQIDLFLALGLFAGATALLWGERRIWVLSIVGLVIPAAVFFIFDLIFKIRFPHGLLTSLWYG